MSAPAPSLCPRCGQDEVGRHRVVATAEEVWLCPECEALWPGAQERPEAVTGFTDFTEFMAARSRPGLWSEVEALPPTP